MLRPENNDLFEEPKTSEFHMIAEFAGLTGSDSRHPGTVMEFAVVPVRVGTPVPRLDAHERTLGRRRPQSEIRSTEAYPDDSVPVLVQKRYFGNPAVMQDICAAIERMLRYRQMAVGVKLHFPKPVTHASAGQKDFRFNISDIERKIAVHRI